LLSEEGKSCDIDIIEKEMEPEQQKPKRVFFKRFWWAGLICLILLISLVGFLVSLNQTEKKRNAEKEQQKQAQINKERAKENQGYKYIEPTMTEAELAKASLALKNGVSIDDPANDFAIPPVGVDADGKSDNQKPYSLGWNDIKKVTFGADNENFYIRYDFYGMFPNSMVTTEGDDIRGIGGNVGLSKFTSTDGTTNEGMWQIGLTYAESKGKDSKDESAGFNIITPRLHVTSIASPTSEIDKHGETIYSLGSDKGKVYGGVGKDFLMAAFPLANLHVLPNSDISFDISVETNSHIYHHSSIDPLLDFGSSKSGKTIQYKLGSNTYTSFKPDYK